MGRDRVFHASLDSGSASVCITCVVLAVTMATAGIQEATHEES